MNVHRSIRALAALLAFSATLAVPAVAAPSAEAPEFTGLPVGGDTTLHVMSLKDRRFQYVVRQQTDFTCGSAAVATVLRYAFNVPVDEAQVTQGLLAVAGPQARQRGFSLLEIKTFLQRIGFNGDGFRLPLSLMTKVVVPTIALVSIGGYEHFVVLRRVTTQNVFVADPVLGNKTYTLADFEAIWTNKIIFRIQGPGYQPNNGLSNVAIPRGTAELVTTIPPNITALSTATLMSVGIIAPAQRL